MTKPDVPEREPPVLLACSSCMAAAGNPAGAVFAAWAVDQLLQTDALSGRQLRIPRYGPGCGQDVPGPATSIVWPNGGMS